MEHWTKYKELYLQNCRAGRRLSAHSLKAYGIDLEQFLEWLKKQQKMTGRQEVDRNLLREYFYALNEKFAAKQ